MRDMTTLAPAEREQIRLIHTATMNAGKAERWLSECREGRDAAIRELRLLGWTIADVSLISGMSPAFISKIGLNRAAS